MADSAKAATADARRTLLALACLLSAFFLNQVPPFLLNITLCPSLSVISTEIVILPNVPITLSLISSRTILLALLSMHCSILFDIASLVFVVEAREGLVD